MKRIFRVVIGALLPLVILVAAGSTGYYILQTAPEVGRSQESPPAPVVGVVDPARVPFERVVEAYGSVRPAKEVSIAPEVSGRVIELHPALEPGGVIDAGEALLTIDPREYSLAVRQAEGALAEAEAALEVERGRQRVAEREWALFGKDLPDAELGRELALREPQLRQAEARIESERSALDRAKLDLERTTIAAPFDALVLEESVDLGQLVNAGGDVATLAGTGAFWVLASVPANRLAAVLEAAESGRNTARIYAEVDRDRPQAARTGRLVRHLGQVDVEGRMAQVLVEIGDPLHLDDATDAVPLPLNSYVRVELDAGTIDDVAAIPRRSLRENNEFWICGPADTLAVRKVDIVWRQDEQLAVRDVFEPGDRLIVSPLADALPGMALRPRDEAAAPETGT